MIEIQSLLSLVLPNCPPALYRNLPRVLTPHPSRNWNKKSRLVSVIFDTRNIPRISIIFQALDFDISTFPMMHIARPPLPPPPIHSPKLKWSFRTSWTHLYQCTLRSLKHVATTSFCKKLNLLDRILIKIEASQSVDVNFIDPAEDLLGEEVKV